MKIHCTIAVPLPQNNYKQIFVYNNGQVEDGVGELLYSYYDASNIESLFALGDLSVLGSEPRDPDFWEPGMQIPFGRCYSYNYRHPSPDNDARIMCEEDYVENSQDFNYLLIDDEWWVWTDDFALRKKLALLLLDEV